MKINFSQIDQVKWLFNNNLAIALLRRENAPLIISFFYLAFKDKSKNIYLNSEINSLLSDYLFETNQPVEQYSGTPKHYLDQWTKEGFLRQYYEPKNDEALFELTPATEQAIRWMTELNKTEFVGTESRLLYVFNMLKDLALGVTDDKEKKRQELEKQKAAIEREIEKLGQEQIDRYDKTKIRESFMLIEESATKLLSDFRQIEENFRKLNASAREDQITKAVSKGKFLDHVFEAQDMIMESDQGKSFRSFWEFLMNQEKQREMETYVQEIFQIPELAEMKSTSFVTRLKVNLVDAGDRVNKTTHLLVEQLRKFIEMKIYLENKRVADIIRQIEELALAVKDSPPATHQFTTIDDKPRVSLVMDRKPYEPPKNPEVDSGNLEEGMADPDSSILFEQQYVNPEALRERIRMLLRGRKQISLGEIVRAIPIEKGLTEVVTYFSIASVYEKENKAIIDAELKETIPYEINEKLNEVTLPKTIFLA